MRGIDDEHVHIRFHQRRGTLEIGLADGIGDLRGVLRERYGKKVRIRTVTRRPGWLRRRFGFSGAALLGAGLFGPPADQAEGGFIDGVLSAIEARAWWSRFGL